MASILFRLGRAAGVVAVAAIVSGRVLAQEPDLPEPPRLGPLIPASNQVPAGPAELPAGVNLTPSTSVMPTTATASAPGSSPSWLTAGPLPVAAVSATATLTDPPKYPTVRLTGMFQLDFLTATQDTRNAATVGNVEDGVDFRRVRIGAVGNVAEDISYQMELDFAASQPQFVDVWANFSKVPGVGNIKVGRFRQPFGMTELTSARELPFLERETMAALSPFRQTGVMAHDTILSEMGTYAASAYRYNSDQFGNIFTDSGGYGLAARLTGLPYYQSDSNLIHLGAGYSYSRPGGTNPVRFQSRPEVFAGSTTGSTLAPNSVSLPPFVDTGLVQVDDLNAFNLEFAVVRDNFLVQSEARAVVVKEVNGNTATLPGFYVSTRYVLTGESIPYNKQSAVFNRVRPNSPVGKGGIGAWELAARWSYIDLNGTDGRTTAGGSVPGPGRRSNDLTLGVNWYLVDNAKFQFNYIHPILNDPTLGTSNADFFAVRCQIDF